MAHALPLDVDGLSFAYPGGFALDRVSLQVRAGRVTMILGPNGAGKTTLVHCICGLLRPDAGAVRILGRDVVAERSAALSGLGIVFQEQTLDLDLTVMQNLIYFAALHGLGPGTARRRGRAVLEYLALAGRAGEKVRILSGGERRRVELARALMNDPPFLLLDEPTVGLDIPGRRMLVADVHALAASGRTSVLWATHLADEVREEDDLVVLDGGRVAASGPVPGVLRDAAAGDVAAAFEALTGPHAPAAAGGHA